MTEPLNFPDKAAFTSVFALESACGAQWNAIRATRDHALTQLASLRESLAPYHDPNCSIVVTGSLGRLESNGQSDADWMLLADSPSDPNHGRVVHDINKVVTDAVSSRSARRTRSARSSSATSSFTTLQARVTRTRISLVACYCSRSPRR